MGPPALAKCSKDCKKALASEFKVCKASCAKGKTGKPCKTACKDQKKSDLVACKAAANPTPPACSASGAFID